MKLAGIELANILSEVEGEESDDGAALDYIQNLAAEDSEDLPEDSKVCCHHLVALSKCGHS